MSDEVELTFGQMLAMQQIDLAINHFIGHSMHSARGCLMIAKSIDDDHLPMNSAHFRAAGLHYLEIVEQVIKAVDPIIEDDDDLAELREDLEKCRTDLLAS